MSWLCNAKWVKTVPDTLVSYLDDAGARQLLLTVPGCVVHSESKLCQIAANVRFVARAVFRLRQAQRRCTQPSP